jgi:hypothetical protein
MSNMSTLRIGDKTSVASRTTSNTAGHLRPCRIVDVNAENFTSGTLYLHYFEGVTTAPATGTTPTEGFPVQANLGGEFGTLMDTIGGIWAWSSTESTFTAAGTSGSIIIYLWSGG